MPISIYETKARYQVEQSGQTSLEYILMVALVCAVVFTSMQKIKEFLISQDTSYLQSMLQLANSSVRGALVRANINILNSNARERSTRVKIPNIKLNIYLGNNLALTKLYTLHFSNYYR